MLEDGLPNLVCEIDARVSIPTFKKIDDPQRLVVVFEPADLGDYRWWQLNLAVVTSEDPVQHRFACVAEGGVTEIVTQRRRLREILVETEDPGNGPCQLADLEGVGKPGARVVTDVGYEDLGLVF